MDLIHAIILGIVEGITEFLPVSSTGHLIIAASLLGMTDDEQTQRSLDGFMIVIQAFALLAVIGLYRRRVGQMIGGLLGRDPAGLRLFNHILIAFLPIMILGPLLYGPIMEYLFRPVPVLIALAAGGVWMIWLDRRRKELGDRAPALSIDEMTWKHAAGIGLFQCVSMWPGTSRAMMTIAGGTMIGLRPAQSAEFSFLLGLPTIGGAMVYQLYKDFYASEDVDAANMIEQLGLLPILVGCAVTVVTAAAAMKWLVGFLDRHGLSLFGWYRIVLCVLMAGLLASGLIAL